jgi:hypothetical protein
MDTVYVDRPQHSMPVIGAQEVMGNSRVLPVVRRGAAGTPLITDNLNVNYLEPMPIKPTVVLTGVELNNLQLLSNVSLSQWAARKTDEMRRAVRRTTEALCAQSIRGVIAHPMKTDGGGDATYQVDYGSTHNYTPATLWSAAAAGAKDIYEVLLGMRAEIRKDGWGGRLKIWAGTKAYLALLKLLDTATPADKIGLRMAETGGILVGGEFRVELLDDAYEDPLTKTMSSVIDPLQVVMIALDGGHRLFYAALDDLDSNLLPMPLFIKATSSEDGTMRLRGESKPLPAPNVRAICWSTVVASS